MMVGTIATTVTTTMRQVAAGEGTSEVVLS
jgi:hypothetical protein